MNNKSNRFSPEVRERAVRLVQEHRGEYPSLWAAVESIAPKIGCVPHTLLEWVKQLEVGSGQRPGATISDALRIKDLEREVKSYAAPMTSLRRPARFLHRRSSTADSSREVLY